MSQYILTPLEVAAGDWLTAVLTPAYTGRIVAADNRGVRPARPFATFKFQDDTTLGATATTELTTTPGDTAGTFKRAIRTTVRATLSVNVYGPTAYADLRRALLKFQDPAVVEATRAAGLTVQSAGTVRRLPGDGSTDREDRAQVDLVVLYVDALDVDQAAVAVVQGAGNLDLVGATVNQPL